MSFFFISLFKIIHQRVYQAVVFNEFRRRSTKLEFDISKQEAANRSSITDQNFGTFSTQLKDNLKR